MTHTPSTYSVLMPSGEFSYVLLTKIIRSIANEHEIREGPVMTMPGTGLLDLHKHLLLCAPILAHAYASNTCLFSVNQPWDCLTVHLILRGPAFLCLQDRSEVRWGRLHSDAVFKRNSA